MEQFLRHAGQPLQLDQSHLRDACHAKIGEAEERINYVSFYLPQLADTSRDTLKNAFEYREERQYPLCIDQASKAKAEANLIAGIIGMPTEQLEELTAVKLQAVAKELTKQQERGYFPIMAYSYYEYAGELAGHDKSSALTFAEYALEMGNLGMYFPREETRFPSVDSRLLGIFLTGLGAGIAATLLVTLGIQKARSGHTRDRSARAQRTPGLKTLPAQARPPKSRPSRQQEGPRKRAKR
ncbi:MAG: hypothetical protein HC945_01460 [Nitrosarchaeum sp.]|nr:hypothetical protein [Nitrosarchaeum sp.]